MIDTVLHAAQVLAGYDHRGAGAGGVEGADHEIGAAEFLLQGVVVEDAGLNRAVELAIELPQPFAAAVEDDGLHAEADGDARCPLADDAGAEDEGPRRGDAGDAAGEETAAALRTLQIEGADQRRHAAGDLAHRREERGAPCFFQSFVGKGGEAAFQQQVGEGAVGGEMEVGEEDLLRPQQLVLGGEGFLDLDQQFAAA